jgi:hypothetical protein
MQQQSLFNSWKKSFQLLQTNLVLESFKNFKKASFIILKYFWWLILLFVLTFMNHLSFTFILTLFVGGFIVFLAAKPTDAKQNFGFFIKSMPLFFKWVVTGGIAINCGIFIAILAGTVITIPFLLVGFNRPPDAFAGLILPLCFLPFGPLSQLILIDNQNKGVFRSIKQSILLVFRYIPFWFVIFGIFACLFFSMIFINNLFGKTISLYISTIELPFFYLFYLSTIIACYLKIQQIERLTFNPGKRLEFNATDKSRLQSTMNS